MGSRWLFLATQADADNVDRRLREVTPEVGDHVHQDDAGRILHLIGRSPDDSDRLDAYSFDVEGFALESLVVDWNQEPPAEWVFRAVEHMPTVRTKPKSAGPLAGGEV